MKSLVFAATALLLMFAAAPTARADEIDDAVAMFTADDGISAAEKIPAVKGLVEGNRDNAKVDVLIALLKRLADEAGDEETKAWIRTLSVASGKSQSDTGGSQFIATDNDDDYVAFLDDENDATPDVRDEDEKKSLYTIEDAQAAADAAATEALKSGTKPWMPPEEALREADEAFKRIGPIPPVPKETKARIKLPEECVADDFLNHGTVLGAIINLRERMRFALGSMSEKDEKEFDRHFDKAMAFPSENIIAWCTNALPIVTKITRLRVALVNEAMSFDEALDEMNMARMVGNYEEAHRMMCSLSRTVASMKSIEAEMKELMPQFEALGDMPDPAKERKKAAKEYEEAKETIQEYFTFGAEVKDKSIEGEWVREGQHVEYKWNEPLKGEQAEEGSWSLERKVEGGLFGADLFKQPTLYIVPIAEFGEQGLANFYVYGEGLTARFRTWKDPPRDKRYDKTDCKDVWMEPCRDGGWATYSVSTNKNGHATGGTRTHFKACKDDDGKDALLVMVHTVRLDVDDDGKKKSKPYHYFETAVYRPTDKVPEAGAATLPLPLSDPTATGKGAATGMATGTTVEEKKRAAEKTIKESSEKHVETVKKFDEMAKAAPFEDAPPPYNLYYVLLGSLQCKADRPYVPHAVKDPDLEMYQSDASSMDADLGGKRPNPPVGTTYTTEINPTRDDENEVPLPATQHVADPTKDVGMPIKGRSGPIRIGEATSIKDRSNTNCFDQTMNYEVCFTNRQGAKMTLDSAYASFLLEWAHPTTVMRAWDNDTCKMTVWPKVKYEPCRKQARFNDKTVGLGVSFGASWMSHVGYDAARATRNMGRSISGTADEEVKMGLEYTNCTVKTGHRLELAFNMGNVLRNEQTVYFGIIPKMDTLEGDTLGFKYVYRLIPMTAEKARELANNLDAKLLDQARDSWKEVPEDGIAQEKTEKSEKEKELDETKEFHQNNIKWLDESIARLKKQLNAAKTKEERYSLQVAIAGAQADKIHEEDMIRAAETGEFHASRTPWDNLTFAKFHEDVVREVKEISEAEHNRKFVENMASKLSAKHETAILERLDRIMEEDPLNAKKMTALAEQLKNTRMYELENDPSRKAAFERANRLDMIVTGLEYTKAGCEVAVSIGCGGAGWSAAKVVGCVYMATTGYMEGGLTSAFKKTVTFAYDSVQVASEFIDGCVEGGLVEGLKRGEISFALNYGVPFLLDKMKGPPDGTGCHNAFDLEKLSKWNPKAATRKPRIADINAEYFETKYSKKLIEGFKEKKAALDGLNALTKTHKVDTKTIVKVKKEYYNALGKVNECPMAKAQLKYNKKYLNDGTSKQFAGCCDRWQNAVKKKAMINMQVKRGYNKQKILNFRNEASTGTVGMDLDIGLDETPNTTVMRGGNEVQEFQITRNGQPVTKYQWASDMQDEVNGIVKLSTGCDARRQSVNVTHSGHPEAFKRVELLKNSKNEEYMRSIFAHSRPSEVEQAFDVSRFKADEMAHVKGHPEIMGRYEQFRGWAKDYDNIYGPALRGEVKALKAERIRLSKFGRDLPKRDIVKCERLEKTLKKYDKIYNVCKRVGDLETPIYMANTELQRITDKEIPELITDLSTTFKALNIGEAKNQRGLMVVQPKNTATKSRPKALPAPKQPKALPEPKKEPVKLLPWFGDKKD